MVLAVALRRVTAISTLLEVVERHDGPGIFGDRRRALVLRIEVPGLAALPADVARARPLQRAARVALVAVGAVMSCGGAGAEAWEGDEQEACQSKHEEACCRRHLYDCIVVTCE